MSHTNVARRRDHGQAARERVSPERVKALHRQRRRRIAVVSAIAAAVVATVVVIVVVGTTGSAPQPAAATTVDAAAVASTVAGVPSATLDSIGIGDITGKPVGVSDPPLRDGSKPVVLYVGAEYCPYCAAERWSLVQALSRFGTFSGLSVVHTPTREAFPNTATFSFHGASYRSDVVSFTGRELATVEGKHLESLTPAEDALWKKYTGAGTFPFVAIGGKYVSTGASYDPAVLHGLPASAIAEQLADPTSKVARAVDGAANVITAAICRTTGNAPHNVCSARGVVDAAQALHD